MYLNVDYVGIDAVARMMEQTGLKKFIIYRQGAPKGSTQVFDCSNSTTSQQAVKSFRDWATNIVGFNPMNGLSYDILLFNIESDVNDESNRKSNKVRCSFALNNFMAPTQQNANSHIDIGAEIEKGIKAAMQDKELKELKDRIKELEEGGDGDEPDFIDKITAFWKLAKDEQAGVKISGDDEDDLDDEAPATEKVNRKFTPEQIEKKKQNRDKALKILWKHNKDLDLDLLRLAKLAQEEPLTFKMTLAKLRSMVKL